MWNPIDNVTVDFIIYILKLYFFLFPIITEVEFLLLDECGIYDKI